MTFNVKGHFVFIELLIFTKYQKINYGFVVAVKVDVEIYVSLGRLGLGFEAIPTLNDRVVVAPLLGVGSARLTIVIGVVVTPHQQFDPFGVPPDWLQRLPEFLKY